MLKNGSSDFIKLSRSFWNCKQVTGVWTTGLVWEISLTTKFMDWAENRISKGKLATAT